MGIGEQNTRLVFFCVNSRYTSGTVAVAQFVIARRLRVASGALEYCCSW